MCLLTLRHPPLVSRFSRVSSTWGFVSFDIRATHHVEYGLEPIMGCGSVVIILERATWGGLRALPQSESCCGRRLQSVVVCYDPKCPTLVKYRLEHVFINS